MLCERLSIRSKPPAPKYLTSSHRSQGWSSGANESTNFSAEAAGVSDADGTFAAERAGALRRRRTRRGVTSPPAPAIDGTHLPWLQLALPVPVPSAKMATK